MQKIEIAILGLSYSQSQSNSYTLILGEVNGSRRIPIVIGHFEAQSIALEMENMKPTRPLTHDLFKNFADIFNIKIEEVVIEKYEEGIFYSTLYCNDGNKLLKIDSRTSDAVSLALRFNCPIYIYENIIEETGVAFKNGNYEENKGETEKDDFMSVKNEVDDLKKLENDLQNAIDEEDYERASDIRDEILKIKNK